MRAQLLAVSLMATAAAAGETETANEARYQALIDELRCLVCQNQTIAESNAPLAADLREQVRTQIDAGRSDAEIAAFLTERYGDFVLYRPPLKPQTALLWLGPFLALAFAGAVVVAFVRRSRGRALPAVDPEQVRRLLAADPDEERRP